MKADMAANIQKVIDRSRKESTPIAKHTTRENRAENKITQVTRLFDGRVILTMGVESLMLPKCD